MRLIKKAENEYDNLPEPYFVIFQKNDNLERYYTNNLFKDITEDEIQIINSTFPNSPISLMMIGEDGSIFYGGYSQIIFLTQNNNYRVVVDNGKRSSPSQAITSDIQLLNQYMPYVKSFMNSNDFEIYLSEDTNLKWGHLALDDSAVLIARSQREFNEYLFNIYLRNNNNPENQDTANYNTKRLIRKSDTMIFPTFPGQRPMLDLRKNKQNQQQNQQNQKNQQNNQNFQQILQQEIDKNNEKIN
ncbi:hypothetical protein D3C81_1424660 [compost metagenome]